MSPPGTTAKCRSASRAVRVGRGSATITLTQGFFLRAEFGDIVAPQEGAIFLEAMGVPGDEIGVHGSEIEQEPAQGIEQSNVAAGNDRQMQIGLTRGQGAPRVGNNHLDKRILLAR